MVTTRENKMWYQSEERERETEYRNGQLWFETVLPDFLVHCPGIEKTVSVGQGGTHL
jgi:hypothetical protein